VLPFGRLLYSGQNATSNAIGYAKFYSRQRGQVKVHNAIPPLQKEKTPFLTAPMIASGVDTMARTAVAFWARACEFKYLVASSG
jgi:hypothetical protein